MSVQLPLDLPLHTAMGRADFAVSDANHAAMTLIEGWQSWPNGKLIVYGEQGAGKTHLAHVWAELARAEVIDAWDVSATITGPHLVIEDVPQISGDPDREEALFHLHNRLLSEGGRLLMTGQSAPATWPIALPDLASRLQGTLATQLAPPDEELLSYVLVKLFADRQLTPSPAAIKTLALNMDRSFAEAGRIVTEMDRRALATRRNITSDLAREVWGLVNKGHSPFRLLPHRRRIGP